MNRVLIIAEAGVNHNGNLALAKEMACVAKECGADIVKFQTAKASSLVTKYARMADYQKENIGKAISQRTMLERILLSYQEFEELAVYCRDIGMEFLSTPFDIESIKFLDKIGCRFWKIPSGEVTDLPYLEAIGNTGKDVILSTGMSSLKEVGDAKRVLQRAGAGEITLLHCTTEYPAPFEEVNLKAMETLQREFSCRVGYSDHTEGIEASIAAVAMGAAVIEKHFTLDRSMEGPDHKASLEPDGLGRLVRAIRNVEASMGDGVKEPSVSERKNKEAARKSIVAKKSIKKGELLTEQNIVAKRPGNGLSPMLWYEIIGTFAVRDFGEDEQIEV